MDAYYDNSIKISGFANWFPSNAKTFKQLHVQKVLEIQAEKPDIAYILRDHVEIETVSIHAIEVPSSKSYEGQVLTGCKLIVNGRIKHNIEYIAATSTQSVHAGELFIDFSTYIMLENSFCGAYSYQVTPYIEDVYLKHLDNRKIFGSVMLLIDAVPTVAEVSLQGLNLDILADPDCPVQYIDELGSGTYFSQFFCMESIVLPSFKPDIKQMVSSIVEPEVISVKFIDSMKGTSAEGQYLTGKKAVLAMKITQKALYAAELPDQVICAVENVAYQCAYIVIPNLIEGTEPEVLYKSGMLKPKITVEHSYFTNLNKRTLFHYISLSLELELIPTYEISYSSYSSCEMSNIFLCHEDGKCTVQITRNQSQKNIKPCWSPNGSLVAYLSGVIDGYDLFVFHMRTCQHRRLIAEHAFDNISSISWLNSNEKLIFCGTRGQCKDLYLLDVTTGSYRQFTNGHGLIKNYYPKVSPDGRSVAYLHTNAGLVNLWVSDITGKTASSITTSGYIRDYDWLPDSMGLVYIDNANPCSCDIYLHDLKSGLADPIIASDKFYGCKLPAVSPNGRYVAFVGTGKISDDVYIYHIESNKLFNITNYRESVKIGSLVWKIDSCKIYYSAKEALYYDLYDVNISNHSRSRLSDTSSAFMQLAYRPRVK